MLRPNRRLATEKIQCLLWNLNFDCLVHKCPTLKYATTDTATTTVTITAAATTTTVTTTTTAKTTATNYNKNKYLLYAWAYFSQHTFKY